MTSKYSTIVVEGYTVRPSLLATVYAADRYASIYSKVALTTRQEHNLVQYKHIDSDLHGIKTHC